MVAEKMEKEFYSSRLKLFAAAEPAWRALFSSIHGTMILGWLMSSVLGRGILALLSAGLLAASLPPFDLGWLAWIALVPLIIACRSVGALHAAALGFVGGMAANFAIYRWSFEVSGFEIYHFLILSSYFALYPAAWCFAISRLTRDPVKLLLAAPALWVLLDYLRANAGFMAFPWGTLAQSQHKNLLVLQSATITGEYGITFLVVLGNALIAALVCTRAWPVSAAGALVIAVVHLGGAWALYFEDAGKTIRVAAIQPSILRGERDTASGRAAVLNRLDRLTRAAAAQQPAVIVWPETTVAGNLRNDPFLTSSLQSLASEVGVPLVLGVGEVEKFAVQDSQGNMVRRAYNSAYFVKPNAPLEDPYLKRVLLPFGEYVPLSEFIGWPAWLAPPVFVTEVGSSPKIFRLDDRTNVAPLICWENLIASLARESVQNGARLLFLLTNDGWFARSAEPYQHNLASVLRAVENRVPVVMASNTGPSLIIDPFGRVVASARGVLSQEVVVANVKVVSGETFYTRYGDALMLILIALVGLVIFGRPVSHRLRKVINNVTGKIL